MAITINGILCDELVEGSRETVSFTEGPSARKGYICNWDERFAVAIGLLGFNQTTTILGRITVNLPHAYPDLPYMYAHTIEIEPRGSPTQGPRQAQWPKTVVWANYLCTPWSFSGFDDPNQLNQFPRPGGWIFSQQRLNSSAEVYTVPGMNAHFATSGKKAPFDCWFRLWNVEMIITFQRVPYLPTAQQFSLSGNINSVPFLGIPAGQLMFNGYQTNSTRNANGTYTSEVTANYTARSQPWDYFFDGVGPPPRWDRVVWPDNTTPFIKRADLTQTIPQGY